MIDVGKVGTHHENREKQMIIQGKVHQIIGWLADEGYNPELVKAMCIEGSPNSDMIEGMRRANARLWANALGMLASSNAEDLDFFAFIGSHLTSAIRGYKFGIKTEREDLAGPDGMIQCGKIFDAQPSVKEPVDKGLAYIDDTKTYLVLIVTRYEAIVRFSPI